MTARAASRHVAAAGVATVLLVAAGWASRPAVGQEDIVEEGRDLFVANCASCHGPGAGGTSQGPPLLGVGAASVDFMLSTGRMPLADPAAQPVRGPVAFTPGEIGAIVGYVTSLAPGGPAVPEVEPGAGDLARGRAVYAANCLACHGAGAQGASVGGGAVAPPLDAATPTELAEAARIGPGAMPRFGPETIDREDLDSVVRYVLALREGQNPGGIGLGHVGPVVEGFVGVVLGLGLLVLAIRFTGTRE
ncbi:MAG: cytochrome bc1 complex diheme cytochrome c subunit [Actinomycetota bacterium]